MDVGDVRGFALGALEQAFALYKTQNQIEDPENKQSALQQALGQVRCPISNGYHDVSTRFGFGSHKCGQSLLGGEETLSRRPLESLCLPASIIARAGRVGAGSSSRAGSCGWECFAAGRCKEGIGSSMC